MKRYHFLILSVLFLSALCFSGCAHMNRHPENTYEVPAPKLEKEKPSRPVMQTLLTGHSPEAQKISENLDRGFQK